MHMHLHVYTIGKYTYQHRYLYPLGLYNHIDHPLTIRRKETFSSIIRRKSFIFRVSSQGSTDIFEACLFINLTQGPLYSICTSREEESSENTEERKQARSSDWAGRMRLYIYWYTHVYIYMYLYIYIRENTEEREQARASNWGVCALIVTKVANVWRMFLRVCICACMYMRLWGVCQWRVLHIYIWWYIHIYIYIYVFIYIYAHTYIYIYMRVWICLYMYTYIYVHTQRARNAHDTPGEDTALFHFFFTHFFYVFNRESQDD